MFRYTLGSPATVSSQARPSIVRRDYCSFLPFSVFYCHDPGAQLKPMSGYDTITVFE
ncbi:hypothetical protein M408DRAFT_331376 [Serendipita vermifera MAFF 305830]|uniref:Uncharacterized protein n=1 Tax=Serendipita vermifera MAFF 305830 TaxID=933852 RepID=A0A0C2X701_SERVB|nr:hypothetical protein M408DRAFT_331376 [Serendipita vermifera MAFF 305830]